METITLKVNGMTCSGCSSGLEKALSGQTAVQSVTANHKMDSCTISYDPTKASVEDLRQWIEAAGFEAD